MTHHNVFLESERLYLRPLEDGDEQNCVRWLNDPEVRSSLTRRTPLTGVAHREWKASQNQGHPPRDIVLAIVLKDADRHIGTIGLHSIDWVNRAATTGTLIGEKDCWSQGFGTESKRLLVCYAFDTLGLHRLNSIVLASNTRSLKCQQKCGYVEEGRKREAILVNGVWTDEIMLGLLADEWRKQAR